MEAAAPMSSPGSPAFKAPLVAVVTPVYNGAKYLAATMACVQRQTYPNLIHVVLDNASTDETPAIIRSFEGGRAPLLTARNANALPQLPNWNAALRMTPREAAYVQWLCADDLIRRDAIEKFVAKAETDPAITCVSGWDVVHDRVLPTSLRDGEDLEEGLSFIQRVCRQEDAHFAWQAFFIRWTPEWAHGDFFTPGMPSFDCEAVLRVIAEGKVAFVKEPLIYTRHHDDTFGKLLARQRNGMQHFWLLEAALRYGSRMPRGQGQKAERAAKRFLARFPLWFRLLGSEPSAVQMEERARALGVPLTARDYANAVFTYPWDFVRTRTLRASAGGGVFARRMTEQEFVGF